MIREQQNLQTELVASEDGKHTYEIRRIWSGDGKKGLVLELYPTVSAGRCGELDLSTMHLMNHAKDFGWGMVRIINLYSTVFDGKPSVKELFYDTENLAYIEEILESKEMEDYDIVIATGNSLSTHIKTIEAKIDILNMLQKNKLDGQVKHIVPETAYEKMAQGVHPLFLGLHFGKEKWSLAAFDIPAAIGNLKENLNEKPEKTDVKAEIKAEEKPKDEKKDRRKSKKKGNGEDVLQNQEQS